jgi:hypothetical protein
MVMVDFLCESGNRRASAFEEDARCGFRVDLRPPVKPTDAVLSR